MDRIEGLLRGDNYDRQEDEEEEEEEEEEAEDEDEQGSLISVAQCALFIVDVVNRY